MTVPRMVLLSETKNELKIPLTPKTSLKYLKVGSTGQKTTSPLLTAIVLLNDTIII